MLTLSKRHQSQQDTYKQVCEVVRIIFAMNATELLCICKNVTRVYSAGIGLCTIKNKCHEPVMMD
jgi:hypothetical protein